MRKAAVLGGGVQGCCVALALARAGWDVDLYEARSRLFAAASANQEGKIHLGFVYARDRSLATARAMIEGALWFAPAIERLVGRALDWEPHLSRRFRCVVHRESSLGFEEHFHHFARLQEIYEELATPELSYLGRRPQRIWRADAASDGISTPLAAAVVATEETAVDPVFVREILLGAIDDHPRIHCRPGHRVTAVEAANGDTTSIVHGLRRGQPWVARADLVVNCLWEGRSAIDLSAGLPEDGPWITRVKYGFLLADDGRLGHRDSVIVIHGPFGDVVRFPRSGLVYVTWYPACRVVSTHGEVLETWGAALGGHHDPAVVARILPATLEALDPFVPGIARLRLIRPLAGTIVGRGETDIDDPDSGLHRRVEDGVRRRGGYLSLFTAKFTRAPLQALRLAERLAAEE